MLHVAKCGGSPASSSDVLLLGRVVVCRFWCSTALFRGVIGIDGCHGWVGVERGELSDERCVVQGYL